MTPAQITKKTIKMSLNRSLFSAPEMSFEERPKQLPLIVVAGQCSDTAALLINA